MGIGNKLFGKDNSAEKAYERQKELMGIQLAHNREMANLAQQNNKEMWDYTNYENQVKHMKAAGLNTALMYGMSGGGGASTHGGSASGVGLPDGANSVMMGLQAATQRAQIANLNAQTNKANAEAASINEHINPKTDQEIENLKGTLGKTLNETELLKFENWINDIKKSVKIEGYANDDHAFTNTYEDILRSKFGIELRNELSKLGNEYTDINIQKEKYGMILQNLEEILKGEYDKLTIPTADKKRIIAAANEMNKHAAILQQDWDYGQAPAKIMEMLGIDGDLGRTLGATGQALIKILVALIAMSKRGGK